MKRIALTGFMLATWGWVSLAEGASPIPLDRPTPPPCAADGTCYPNENTWGWYPCRWRKWPGEELVPTPAGVQPTPADRMGTDLKPYETPTPEQEDAQAPPSTTKKNESGTTSTPEGAQTTPSDEERATSRPSPTSGQPPASNRPSPPAPATPYQATPNYPTPNYPTPNRPKPTSSSGVKSNTSDADPPPSLPWKMTPPTNRAAMAESIPRTKLQERAAVTRPPSANDPPPSIPSVFHSAGL
jgi:hypothetical protein